MKIAGKTGIVCRVDGEPIYRRTRFSFNAEAEDSYKQHDNVEELRTAYAEEQTSAVRQNDDFSIGG